MKRTALQICPFSSAAFGTPHGEAAIVMAETQIVMLYFDFVVVGKSSFKNV